MCPRSHTLIRLIWNVPDPVDPFSIPTGVSVMQAYVQSLLFLVITHVLAKLIYTNIHFTEKEKNRRICKIKYRMERKILYNI